MKLFLIAFLFVLPFTLSAQSEVFKRSGVAINGYDAVAYFTQGVPVKGEDQLSYDWKDASWKFSSAENLAKFKSNPEKYAPQYGGYCAYGMAEGHKASTQPDAWTIVDGKLYFNYNLNVRTSWRKDIPGNIKRAEKNWPTVKRDQD
jgi:YHS domain-containing protein